MKTINQNSSLSILLIAFVFLSLSSCTKESFLTCIKPSGSVETKTFSFTDFDELNIEVNSNVTIEEADAWLVEIKAAQNILDRLEDKSSVSGNELRIRLDKCTVKLEPEDVEITITMPSLRALKYCGNGSVESVNTIQAAGDLDLNLTGNADFVFDIGSMDEVKFDFVGNGDMNANIEFANVVIQDIVGNGTMKLKGTTTDQIIDNDGNVNIYNFDLIAQNTYIDFTGNGDAEIYAEELLDVKMTGNGSVCYRGAATELTSKVTGNGTLQSCN